MLALFAMDENFSFMCIVLTEINTCLLPFYLPLYCLVKMNLEKANNSRLL